LCEQGRDLVGIASDHLGGPECVVEANEQVRDDEAALGKSRSVIG